MPVVIKINHDAIHELLTGPEIIEFMRPRAERCAQAAGEGVEVEGPTIGRTRARFTIRTATFDAMLAEATQRTLTRAIDALR